jgi:hypothetical protein
MAREIAEEGMRMVRADLELARRELGAAMLRFALAIGLMVTSAVFVLIAVIEALGSVPVTFGPKLFGDNPWAPWLVLGGVFLLLALLFGLLGFMILRRAIGGTKGVVSAIKEDVEWARRLTRRGKIAS